MSMINLEKESVREIALALSALGKVLVRVDDGRGMTEITAKSAYVMLRQARRGIDAVLQAFEKAGAATGGR